MNNRIISLVIPVHNEQDNLLWHHDKITNFLDSTEQPFEIIYVDDGSTDDSLALLRKLQKNNPKTVHYLSLSRNFGKESATTAGLGVAKGDAVVVMDADGQHPIELVKTFIELWHAGNDVVIGVRTSNKNEGVVKKYGSKLFYATLKFIGGKEVVAGTTDFRLIDQTVVAEFNKFTERNRVTRTLDDLLGCHADPLHISL